MSTKPRTYVAIILDKSGSMAGTKTQTIKGFNELVQQLKEDSKNQEIFCSLVTFNGDVFEHLWNVSADELVEASPESYVPNGSTAMRDAIGYTIQKLIDTTEYGNENNSYLVYAFSDGETNADKHFSGTALKETIEGCQATKKWTFSYMGCSDSYLKEISRQTGVPIANMAAWRNDTSEGAGRAFENLRGRQRKYFAARAMGSKSCSNYASDEDSIVANFSETVLDVAPISADYLCMETGANVNLDELAAKMPKYVNQEEVAWAGDKMFANSRKVEWKKG